MHQFNVRGKIILSLSKPLLLGLEDVGILLLKPVTNCLYLRQTENYSNGYCPSDYRIYFNAHRHTW